VEDLYDAPPSTIVCLHVDDQCLTIRADTEEQAMEKTEVLTQCAIHGFTVVRSLPFAEDKAFLFGCKKIGNKHNLEQVERF
jgi:hypothetical protein